ncbi:MAG: carbonic anhydrase family protein [Thiotrichaceae bacterium]|nr:carbonic anhydrase family protein [Thiotrichaceae bacterium]
MKKGLLLSLCSILAMNVALADTSGKEWSYSGANGPEHWGKLAAEFSQCGAGKNQSPVNIDPPKVMDANQEDIALNYTMLMGDVIKNTGHTIQVDMRSGGSMMVDGKSFKLKQFHFHTPSENTVFKRHFPMEAHFVHQNEAGELAVMAMMFKPGKADKTVAKLWESLPMKKGDSAKLSSNALKAIESESKLSKYYRFNGSLTTPPCTEGVRWIMLETPMTVSEEQIKALQGALKHPNNRPVQDLNARIITN